MEKEGVKGKGKDMRNDSKKIKWMILLMIGLVVVSVVITASVVIHMMSKTVAKHPWEEGTSQVADTEIRLENVYIKNCEDDKITFLFFGESYSIKGHLSEPYRGVADIILKNDEIVKLCLKKAQIEGTLLSYSADDIEVEGYGLVPQSRQLHVYDMEEEEVTEISLSDISIGEKELSFVIGEGEICAVIKKERIANDSIRVLIKNGSSIEYEKLYLAGSAEWTLNGALQEANTAVEMTEYISNMRTDVQKRTKDAAILSVQIRTAQAICENGFLYITDKEGTRISSEYEGIMLVRESENGVVLINQLPMEDYVRYVLPSEMEDFFPFEAQKAQAVCARTFAYSQMKNKTYAAYGANVDDSTSFQVYNRFGTTELTDRAVEETSGEVILCNDEPISCYYYSTSPGMTENMEVWNEENPEYITSVCTLIEDVKSAQNLKKRANFLDFIQSEPLSYDSKSPYYRWTAKLDLGDYEDVQYGKIEGIEITRRSKSGYVTELVASYENGSKQLTDENEIRRFLGRFLVTLTLSDGSTREDMTMLPSACFIVTDNEKRQYTLCGGGFGHGIGMSQYAAGAMAEAGMTYDQIISFFYKNIEIRKK